MDRVIGLWETYPRGEVYRALGRLFGDLTKRGFALRATLPNRAVPIADVDDFVRQVKDVERTQGVGSVLELLITGLQVTCQRTGHAPLHVTVLLRAPEGEQGSWHDFRSMVVNWVESSGLAFMDRCFQSTQPLFLHTPLERSLKRTFGFRFQYKILIQQGAS